MLDGVRATCARQCPIEGSVRSLPKAKYGCNALSLKQWFSACTDWGQGLHRAEPNFLRQQLVQSFALTLQTEIAGLILCRLGQSESAINWDGRALLAEFTESLAEGGDTGLGTESSSCAKPR